MFEITDLDIERFTCGDCHIFARAMNRCTGWELQTFYNGSEPDGHAFVVTPDGRRVDIEGAWTPSAHDKAWDGKGTAAPCRYSILKEYGWLSPTYGKYSYPRAKQLAPIYAQMAANLNLFKIVAGDMVPLARI